MFWWWLWFVSFPFTASDEVRDAVARVGSFTSVECIGDGFGSVKFDHFADDASPSFAEHEFPFFPQI
jgi:hypothetical protein